MYNDHKFTFSQPYSKKVAKIKPGIMKLLISSFMMFLIFGKGLAQDKTTFVIATSEVDNLYMFCAIYDKNVSQKILKSVNNCLIKDNNLFLRKTIQEKRITLGPNTKLQINIKPGELRIVCAKVNKVDTLYDTLKRRCNDLADEINDASGYKHNFEGSQQLSVFNKTNN